MKYNGVPTACESFSYGQVEDYSINITASGTVAEEITAGLIETTAPAGFAVYPNPVESELNVSISEENGYSYKILNTLGQQLGSGQVVGAIDVSKLSTGIYLIELNNGDKKIVKKFAKK